MESMVKALVAETKKIAGEAVSSAYLQGGCDVVVAVRRLEAQGRTLEQAFRVVEEAALAASRRRVSK